MTKARGFPSKRATDKQRKYLRWLGAPRWDDPKLTVEEASEMIHEHEMDNLDFHFVEWDDFDD